MLSDALARDVQDPAIGFLTVTRVKVSPDLQLARVHYTTMGDEKQRAATKAALERVKPFLRRQIGQKIRLRRVPELIFHFDEGIAHQARVEEILLDIQKEREANPYRGDDDVAADLQVRGGDLQVRGDDLQVRGDDEDAE